MEFFYRMRDKTLRFFESFFRLVIKPAFAFDKKGHEEYQIPSNAIVEYVVTMKKFTRAADVWKLKSKESFDEAHRLKDLGTAFLKKEKYKTALKLYERAKTYRVTGECIFKFFLTFLRTSLYQTYFSLQ